MLTDSGIFSESKNRLVLPAETARARPSGSLGPLKVWNRRPARCSKSASDCAEPMG